MNLQYISDSKGQTTGVFIPINEWNDLKSKYKDLEWEEIDTPEGHENIVRERLNAYAKNPSSAIDFDSALDDVEENL
jgi:hypothetical protein